MKLCRWYDETSAIKNAYDERKIAKQRVENYCWNGGKSCVRKKRFQQEGYASPGHLMPDGSIDQKLKAELQGR